MKLFRFAFRVLVSLAILCPAFLVAATRQPNIVFIFSDDHAFAAISAYNDPRRLIQTPNMDRLAREGMIFHRAMVPNSICGPSRACVLTGKYSHMNGFYDNVRSRFDGSQQTMPKLLQAAGYQTAVVGKWHLISDPTGFDYWDILPGQGIYYNPPMNRMGEKIKREGYTTDIITDLSLDWLKKRDKSKPFLLMCQHKAPHREWSPNLKNLGWNGDRKFAEPETLFDDYSGRGEAEHKQDMTLEKTFTPLDAKLTTPGGMTEAQLKIWNAYYEPRNQAFTNANLHGKDLVRWRYQRYMHDYLGAVLSVDESVGRVLKYLDDEGLAENTIVVYSSDQGFYLGEHGWFDKRWIFEESLRTPLLVRWPGRTKPGSTNKDIVSNIDFASTFLEAAGLPIPADIQGRSLVPVLQGKTPADWRRSFYYHYYEYPGSHNVRRHYGVVTDRYKLVHFYAPDVDYWELFDLQKDPQEMRSVYGQPNYAATQKELHAELERLRTELKVPKQDPPESLPLPDSKKKQPETKQAT
ncbi:MAG: sulfatase [Verrucomicrobia bacterium]|nr:sulfatase [Verrucomicrobiota bacterium]